MPFSRTTATKSAGPKKLHQTFTSLPTQNEGTAVQISAEEASSFAPITSKKTKKAARKAEIALEDEKPAYGIVGWVTKGDEKKLIRAQAEKQILAEASGRSTVIGDKKAIEAEAKKQARKTAKQSVVCYKCGKQGHISRRCPATRPEKRVVILGNFVKKN